MRSLRLRRVGWGQTPGGAVGPFITEMIVRQGAALPTPHASGGRHWRRKPAVIYRENLPLVSQQLTGERGSANPQIRFLPEFLAEPRVAIQLGEYALAFVRGNIRPREQSGEEIGEREMLDLLDECLQILRLLWQTVMIPGDRRVGRQVEVVRFEMSRGFPDRVPVQRR